MKDLAYRPLGIDPGAEALRMRELCINSKPDLSIFTEFEETITAYTTLDLPSVTKRVAERYCGDDSPLTGSHIDVGKEVVGIAWASIKDFAYKSEDSSEAELIRGVNVSAWLLSPYRGKGLGRQIITHATDLALACSDKQELENWYGRKVWTSVNATNTASRKACEYAGFVAAGPHIGMEGRLLYLLQNHD